MARGSPASAGMDAECAGAWAGRSGRPEPTALRLEPGIVRAHLRGARAPGGPPGRSIRRGTARTYFPGPLLIRALCVPGPGPGVAACWWRSPRPTMEN
ncbi:hypothetical protein NDU88_008675 [Pleurodeles waltl]|uniref:Uncharacterized protein n=1 Tax=Pleurodeles waltl TaxID=8319 RepID=A0AAV7N801_PLEWA|nr:hypothetical protein NDU88_008675 [Pleurodeles waltl]